MGPTSVGLMSDFLAPTYGAESLRYALMFIVPAALTMSGIFYLLAARYIRGDLERAPA